MPGKEDLYQTVAPPEHMAYLWWGWSRALQKRGFSEMELAFTIHDDVGDFSKANGLYLMLSYGWAESSGHEGDFIGVRRFYDWGPGDYVVRLAPDGADQHGEWLGLWIAESSTGTTTWIGSLRLPRVKGEARIAGPVHSTVEIYGGGAIRPIDIPTWHVSIKRPRGDGHPAEWGQADYSMFGAAILNSDIRYDGGQVHTRVGGLTERLTDAWEMALD